MQFDKIGIYVQFFFLCRQVRRTKIRRVEKLKKITWDMDSTHYKKHISSAVEKSRRFQFNKCVVASQDRNFIINLIKKYSGKFQFLWL